MYFYFYQYSSRILLSRQNYPFSYSTYRRDAKSVITKFNNYIEVNIIFIKTFVFVFINVHIFRYYILLLIHCSLCLIRIIIWFLPKPIIIFPTQLDQWPLHEIISILFLAPGFLLLCASLQYFSLNCYINVGLFHYHQNLRVNHPSYFPQSTHHCFHQLIHLHLLDSINLTFNHILLYHLSCHYLYIIFQAFHLYCLDYAIFFIFQPVIF